MIRQLFFAFLFFTLISCQKKQREPLILPSNGNINTLTVVTSNDLWAGTIGQTVRDMYAYPSCGPSSNLTLVQRSVLEILASEALNIKILLKTM